MSPTSKNALKIGAALIVIALLLVCGPLSGRFGGGDKPVEAPPVAAGPPVDATDAVEAAAAGALVGSAVEEPETAVVEPVVGDDETPAVVAGAAVAGAGAGAAAAAATAGSGGAAAAAPPPPVSAGVPEASVAAPLAAAAPPVDEGAAARAFDQAFAPGMVPLARNRFAPPVAAPAGGPVEPFGIADARTLRPCESAGSGCQDVGAAFIGGGGVTPFGAGNPRGTP